MCSAFFLETHLAGQLAGSRRLLDEAEQGALKGGGVYQHVASRCTRCEGYASIAFGLAQVDSVALAKTKGLLPCTQREDLARESS